MVGETAKTMSVPFFPQNTVKRSGGDETVFSCKSIKLGLKVTGMMVNRGKRWRRCSGKARRKRTERERGIKGGDWQGQVSHENNHKISSCFPLGNPRPLSDCHTPKEKPCIAVQFFFLFFFTPIVCVCGCNDCALYSQGREFQVQNGITRM